MVESLVTVCDEWLELTLTNITVVLTGKEKFKFWFLSVYQGFYHFRCENFDYSQ